MFQYRNKVQCFITQQVREQGFDQIKFPVTPFLWFHFYGKPEGEHNIPTYDTDGCVTTLIEMLQPSVVSNIGIAGVYQNDRQARQYLVTEEYVDSRKFEMARVLVWVSTKNLILDIQEAMRYTDVQPVNYGIQEQYGDLEDLLGAANGRSIP